MKFLSFDRSGWDIGGVAVPWNSHSSIYGHILAHLQQEKPGLKEGGEKLPDEDHVRGNAGFGWAPGALEGSFVRHGGSSDFAQVSQDVLNAFQALTARATSERARALYSLLVQHSAIDYIDQLLKSLADGRRINPDRLYAIAHWIAMGAPDREPVKTSIAIMGLLRGGDCRDLLLTLGRHEEFTLYVATALQNMEADPEPWLWELGKYVTGWGRIHIVERLFGTDDERIKTWLLREGYRNDIMTEYTALTCARTGGLLEALRRSEDDEQLLKNAGEILGALICGRGAPAEGMEAYPEGAEVAELYLQRLQNYELDIEAFNSVTTIESFLNEEEGEVRDVKLGWPQRRAIILEHISAIRSRPGWEEMVHKGLASDDQRVFWNATVAAKTLGIDTWEIYFERLVRGEDRWYFAMQTGDPARIDKVVQLAEERLPLEAIACGPADELGLGPEFQSHSALDFVLQDLRRFPGKGWLLIKAGLQSPVTRNRNMALRALSAWKREAWPAEAEFMLRLGLNHEPNSDTHELMRKIIAGEKLGF
jgi:hypothetical protein